MTKRTPNFARVLAPSPSAPDADTKPLQGDEIGAVLEIGYAMANANGHASFDELDSFRALAKHLEPGADVGELLDGIDGALSRAESMGDFVRASAKRLGRPAAREAAYKVAYTIAVFDLETNEEERELDDLLVDVLDLGARVDALEAEVNQALSG